MFAYEKEKYTVTSRYGALRVFSAVKYDLFATETIHPFQLLLKVVLVKYHKLLVS